MNRYVSVPTNKALVCHVQHLLRVHTESFFGPVLPFLDLAMVATYRFSGKKDSGRAANAVDSLYCVDLDKKLLNVQLLPLEYLCDTVYLAPVPPKWAAGKPMRQAILRQYRPNLQYVLQVDQR